MRLTLRQLQIFVSIAECGSTAAAADGVALSQSATSAALNELEGILQTRLFDRVGKRLAINEVGRQLLPQAKATLDGANEIELQFGASGFANALRIGASTTIGNYLLPRLIAQYRRRNTASQVGIEIANTRQIAAAVADFKLDLGLVEGPVHEAELVAQPWITDRMVIVAAPRHPLATAFSGRKVPLASLREAEWLLRETGSGTREAVEHALLPHLHALTSGINFGDSEAIKRAVAEGLGISCLSVCVVEDLLKTKKLIVLASSVPPIRRHFYLIHHRKKNPSKGMTRFLEFCLEHATVAEK
jgi:DNA-binding transcriptional LysR family regulator